MIEKEFTIKIRIDEKKISNPHNFIIKLIKNIQTPDEYSKYMKEFGYELYCTNDYVGGFCNKTKNNKKGLIK